MYVHEWPEEETGEEFDVWIHGDKSELYYELQCDNQEQGDDEGEEHITNIHTKATWEIFNTVYNQILVESSTKQSTSSIPSKYDTNGYHYPIEIKYDPIVGRGVYALQDISKGSLLYTSINTATFLEGQTFRNFLKALSTNHNNKKLACDVMIWSYVRLIKPPKSKSTTVTDEGSFINSADYEYQYNMALGTSSDTTPGGILYNDPTITNKEKIELWYGCEMKFYASQDIKRGEEIRADYSDFVETDGWKFLGL
ncbi:hypothetical protein FRACYDRAFT_247972 [Fragilariopsis cylindrus CCMP1102]|uniref:SET domain-containing protein n=1 Tax=Fragilariopsis cylindrus CCMP1102 TaxID=635003 RepID=A0A1E7EV25_9STRA|nr:hypothetical protein FRACYDRAFT_247972 [Fragilariopsis cylindrus CCMP1102]|eukprot:OEU09716.1 hypothetical protein FRACYDRAFT_247972 [Fragilariopsis cylindrus CCMP1102]